MFCFVPVLVHFGQTHVAELAAVFLGACLHMVEARYEFTVGAFECVLGVDAEQASGVDHAEKQVAELGLDFGLVARSDSLP